MVATGSFLTEQQLMERLAESVGGRERLAGFFASRTMFDLNKRAESELRDGAATILDAVERTEKAIKAAGLEEYHSGSEALVCVLIRSWAMFQNAGSRTLNWMVTGRSNFPVARNQKRMDSEMKRYQEFAEIAKTAPERAVRIARRTQRTRIGAGGLADIELQDLRRRLEERETLHARMKATNEEIRRHRLSGAADAPSLVALLRDRGFRITESIAVQLLTPDWGRAGYETYQLSNNLAEIKRLQGRIAQVEAKVARIKNAPDEPAEREVNGVRIVEDNADDRLRLYFPGKPAREVIQSLKSNGFRWSPSAGAWQRQITPNARYAAERVVAQVAV